MTLLDLLHAHIAPVRIGSDISTRRQYCEFIARAAAGAGDYARAYRFQYAALRLADAWYRWYRHAY